MVGSSELLHNKTLTWCVCFFASELYFTESNQGCRFLQSQVGRHFLVSLRRDSVPSAPEL